MPYDRSASGLCRYDPDADADSSVLLRGQDGGYLRFYNRRRPDHHVIRNCVEGGAPGMRAELHDVTAYPDWHVALFLDELASDFRGWDGTRSWHSPNRDLRVQAIHHARGHVRLTWTLEPWRHSVAGYWTATTITDCEAGAELGRLAATLHRFLAPASPPNAEDADRYLCSDR
ncbi:DUF6228 family protein [Amycolatopsis nigrescens]|uniref:DUF6228 family protein n=1 Tax=Amycolatopsis nigrescens TaxID=381445 RepID=UPI000376DA69|nr:DUF6228 family protein [Amycolatopsis nigrescens]